MAPPRPGLPTHPLALACFAALWACGPACGAPEAGSPPADASAEDAAGDVAPEVTPPPVLPVVDGGARFTVLTPRLIRLEYSADATFEDRPTQTLAERPASGAPFETSVVGDERRVETDALVLRYRRGSGAFSSDNLVIELKAGGAPVQARPVWGGTGSDPENLGGWRRSLDNEGQRQALHDGVLSRAGWYLLDDSATALRTDDPPGFAPRPDPGDGYQDGYFFGYGLDYRAALADLRTLTGPAPLLPKKALGVWFSRYWPYTAEEWKEVVLAFRAHAVPLDTVSVDTDWKRVHDPELCEAVAPLLGAEPDDACSWNGWDWNRAIFPDPEGFVRWMHEHGVDVGLNIHPSINGADPAYPAVEAATGGLEEDPASPGCQILQFDLSNPCYVFDLTRADEIDAYFALHAPIAGTGIDFWWFDWCCEGTRASAPGLTADTWINELYAREHEAMGSRWPAFSRIGGSFQEGRGAAGNRGAGAFAEHRYALHFTGDTCGTWEMLGFAAEVTAAEGHVGMPYVSHDIGSFLGPLDEGASCVGGVEFEPRLPDDMYVRWVQLGTFQPIDRLHSHHGLRLPWEYPGEAGEVASEFLRLRGRLVPYLYTLSRVAHDTGLPMARSLPLQWPELEEAYQHRGQFTLGDDVLVATVAVPGAPAQVDVWIPPGEWVDLFTGERVVGPTLLTRDVPLDEYPVYVRAGAILPLQPDLPTSPHGPQDDLTLRVWAGGEGDLALYEDEGRGFAYREGRFRWTPLSHRESPTGGCHTVSLGAPQGEGFEGALDERSWRVVLAGVDRPAVVSLNGAPLGEGSTPASWSYDEATRTVTVQTGPLDARAETTLRVGTACAE